MVKMVAPSNEQSEQRPPLDEKIAVRDFQDFYWLKEELVAFCRAHGLLTTGSKVQLAQRIEQFLIAGPAEKEQKRTRTEGRAKPAQQEPLSVTAVITDRYRSDEIHRAFFKSVIGPHFHFTTRFMRFCKENCGKTYQDAIDEWYREVEQKKDPTYQSVIAPQFEYNQHTRDFLQAHPDKTRQDAIEAWNIKKGRRKSFGD